MYSGNKEVYAANALLAATHPVRPLQHNVTTTNHGMRNRVDLTPPVVVQPVHSGNTKCRRNTSSQTVRRHNVVPYNVKPGETTPSALSGMVEDNEQQTRTSMSNGSKKHAVVGNVASYVNKQETVAGTG